MREQINLWIEAHTQELLEDIKALCDINSAKSEALPDKPFGEGPYQALTKARELCEKYGFETRNYENFVAVADYDTSLERSLDILAHTDVVPAGEGWTVTEPFHTIEKDGKLYGRGTSDDKGPLLCALYAMRALKENGVKLKKGVRLVMGSDEESGSEDIEKYYSMEPEAEMTFSPDGCFPVINIEKGMFRGVLKKSFSEEVNESAGNKLLSLKAGLAINAVPQKASLLFERLDQTGLSAIIEKVESDCGVKVTCSDHLLTVTGVSAHASTPEMGKNAGIAALYLLSLMDLGNQTLSEAIRALLKLFPYAVTDGSGLGIRMSDAESGDLTCSLDLFHIENGEMEFQFDCRTPLCANEENCLEVAREKCVEAGFQFETDGMTKPHRVAGDSDFVKKLLHSYELITGREGKCIAIGGGTYVHDLKNGVAFGAILPEIDTRMHGADEFMDIENIRLATKVYAEAILELCVEV